MTDNALVPQTGAVEIVSQFGTMSGFEFLQRQAKMLASSSIVPEQFSYFDKNGKLKDQQAQAFAIANSVIALEISHRIAASPLMVAQNLVLIHGRPTWSSQFVIAAINACGRFSPLRFRVGEPEPEKEIQYSYTEYIHGNKQTKTGKVAIRNRECVAWTHDKKTGDVLEGPPVSIEMAVKEGWYTKNGSKWVTMPDLMLRYRAAAFFGRLYAPDLLMGMRSVDEAVDIGDDVIDMTPVATENKISDINAEIRAQKLKAKPVEKRQPEPEKKQPEKATSVPPQNEKAEAKVTAPAEPVKANTEPPVQPEPKTEEIPPTAETAAPPKKADVPSSQAVKETAAGTDTDIDDDGPKPQVVAELKAEIDKVKTWGEAYKWENANHGRLTSMLPNADDRSQISSYVNYVLHARQIDECPTDASINEWAEMKMSGLLKQFEMRHKPTAAKLYEMVQKYANARIEFLRRSAAPAEAVNSTEQEPEEEKRSKQFVKLRSQLYGINTTLGLDRWLFSSQAGRANLESTETMLLDSLIADRRLEIKEIEKEGQD